MANTNYTGVSIVDYLKSIGQDSSVQNRTKMATQYGIQGYDTSADSNTRLLNSMRSGSTPAPTTYTSNPSATHTAKGQFIASNYTGPSVVDYLKSTGQDSSPQARTQLAVDRGIQGYNTGAGNADLNTQLLNSLRSGAAGSNNSTAPSSDNTSQMYTPAPATTNQTYGATQSPEGMAFESYLKTLAPSAEETQAKQYLDRLTTDSRLAREKALNSGETMGFAGGEAARVQRNNDITLEGAARVYDTARNTGDSSRAVSKARYDYAKDKASTAAVLERENTKPFELSEGQRRYTYDKATKQYKLTASAPKTYAPKALNTSNSSAMINDVNESLAYMVNHKEENQHLGIDEKGYNKYIGYLQNKYGSKAVTELNKAMANQKLKVDRVNNK